MLKEMSWSNAMAGCRRARLFSGFFTEHPRAWRWPVYVKTHDVARNAMKLTMRRLLNLLMYLSFCVMIGTGLMMAYLSAGTWQSRRTGIGGAWMGPAPVGRSAHMDLLSVHHADSVAPRIELVLAGKVRGQRPPPATRGRFARGRGHHRHTDNSADHKTRERARPAAPVNFRDLAEKGVESRNWGRDS